MNNQDKLFDNLETMSDSIKSNMKRQMKDLERAKHELIAAIGIYVDPVMRDASLLTWKGQSDLSQARTISRALEERIQICRHFLRDLLWQEALDAEFADEMEKMDVGHQKWSDVFGFPTLSDPKSFPLSQEKPRVSCGDLQSRNISAIDYTLLRNGYNFETDNSPIHSPQETCFSSENRKGFCLQETENLWDDRQHEIPPDPPQRKGSADDTPSDGSQSVTLREKKNSCLSVLNPSFEIRVSYLRQHFEKMIGREIEDSPHSSSIARRSRILEDRGLSWSGKETVSMRPHHFLCEKPTTTEEDVGRNSFSTTDPNTSASPESGTQRRRQKPPQPSAEGDSNMSYC